MTDESDHIDKLIEEYEDDMTGRDLAFLRMFGELVRGIYLLAMSADELTQRLGDPDADMYEH